MEAVSARYGALEVLDRGGRVEHRIALHGQTIRIGRGYDNELILDDPYVSPNHAQISVDVDNDHLLLRDLDSLNGVCDEAGGRIRELELRAEQRFLIGACVLRFRAADFPVAPALTLDRRLQPLQRVWVAVALLLTFLFAQGCEAILDSYEAFDGLKWLNALMTPLFATLVWAGLWALVSRLIVHRLNFFAHVAVVSFGLVLSWIFSATGGALAFALGVDRWLSWLQAVALFVVFAMVSYGHLRFATGLARRTRLVVCLIVGMLLAGSAQLSQRVREQQFSANPRYSLTLHPPQWRIRRASSTENFYKRVGGLADKLGQEH
jgi:Inner membrane component of T3SS, cytoplasmic domain